MTMLHTILFSIFLSKLCSGANILAIFPLPGFSHFVMFAPLMEELARRGHNVDVVSFFPLKNPIDGYNDMILSGNFPSTTNRHLKDIRHFPNVKMVARMTSHCGAEFCKSTFEGPQLQVLKQSSKKYDLLITELFASNCMLGFAWYFGVPSVVMTTSINLPWAAESFGLPDNPSYIPNYFMGATSHMSLSERLRNTWSLVLSKILYQIYSLKPSNLLLKKFFGKYVPDLEILVRNTSLQLVNTHFSISDARPLVPNVVEVGGIHIREDRRGVPENFDEILNTDKNQQGVIYFSLGTVLSVESLSGTKISGLFEAFAELPYKILWKWSDISSSISISLGDFRVKLFISHEGMMGLQEAVYCDTPILGITIFADQYQNIKKAEDKGFAIMLDYDDLSKESISHLYFRYAFNAKAVSRKYKDRPMSALDTAVYWVEYVIRYKGAPNLQSSAKSLAWYQYYLLDVIGISLGTLLMVICIFSKLVKGLYRSAQTKAKYE
ncbi:UDP-glucosyltransferase 2-like [Euwallacea fornicatus]|uniref:UDP-glucosyltransferase 2-like n=1 Tax=Euwallacea fornicatus TaxID=995702 RepID=UPI00338EEC13